MTFTKSGNQIYDRFQLLNEQQEVHENLETFYSRLREIGSKTARGTLEYEFVKKIFLGKNDKCSHTNGTLFEGKNTSTNTKLCTHKEWGQKTIKKFFYQTSLTGKNSRSLTYQQEKQNQQYYQHPTQNKTHNVGDAEVQLHQATTTTAQ